jgi:perosamine synthetase
MSWFVYVIQLDDGTDRDAVIQGLARRGIPSRPYFPCIHLQRFYREQFGFEPGDFPAAEAASRRTLALPFQPNMSTEEVEVVVAALEEAVVEVRRRSAAVLGAGASA